MRGHGLGVRLISSMKIKRIALLFPLLLTAVISSCASGPHARGHASTSDVVKSDKIPLVGSFQVQRYVLGNGLKLLVVEDHSSPTFAYQTWFSVGSGDEVSGKTGLAHLFEHLMFKATTTHPEGEFDHILEGSGVEEENAFTSWDYTAYVQELPKDKLDLIAQLESDRMVNLVVNDDSFKTEREVVQNERRFRTENSPDGMIWQDLYELAFENSSYHWPVIGYEKDLNDMTAEDPRSFYRAYYSPNHATIIVVGDVVPGDVLKTIQKYYGGFLPQNTPAHSVVVEPAQMSDRHKEVSLNIQVEKLALGFKIPGIMTDDIPTLDVLDALLTGGKSSRLQRALVDTGIASSIGTSVMEQRYPTLFVFECNLQQSKKAFMAESVIMTELERLGSEQVSLPELERAKNRVQFTFYQGMEGSGDKAGFLGRYEAMTGSFERGLEIQRQTLLVTPQQLQAVVQKYFASNNRTVITGVIK
jgi:zinc protease